MGFTIRQDEAKVKATRQFQVNAELRDVQLLDCSATASETPSRLEGQLLLGLKMETVVLSAPEGSARFAVRLIAYGDLKDAQLPPEKHLFEVTCRYALQYVLKSGYSPPQEALDAFKDGNAVFQCWPYARELVQNLTMRMGLQIPPLPLLRLAPKSPPKKQSIKPSPPTEGSAATEQRER
jgi:hypothetical protein